MTPISLDKQEVIADGVDVITVSDIPVGGTAQVFLELNGSKELMQSINNISDGVLEVSFDSPGTYWVKARGDAVTDGVPNSSSLEAMINAS